MQETLSTPLGALCRVKVEKEAFLGCLAQLSGLDSWSSVLQELRVTSRLAGKSSVMNQQRLPVCVWRG
jgi:hypothetical protein